MELTPKIFDPLSFFSFVKAYKGALRNFVFLALFWVAGYYFGSYLLEQSDKYFENEFVDPNPPFGYFLIGVLVLDFAAYFIKSRTIKYYIYQHKDFFSQRMGCLSILESFMIGGAVLFGIVPNIWVVKIIRPALPTDSSAYNFILFFMVAKWGIVAYKELFMTPNKKGGWEENPPKAPPKMLDHIANIILTLTTTVLYTVIWQLAVTRFLREHPSFTDYFGTKATIVNIIGYPLFLCAYAIALYMPTRLVFIMEDYYSLTNPKHRRAAFLSSVIFIVFSVINTLINTVTHI